MAATDIRHELTRTRAIAAGGGPACHFRLGSGRSWGRLEETRSPPSARRFVCGPAGRHPLQSRTAAEGPGEAGGDLGHAPVASLDCPLRDAQGLRPLPAHIRQVEEQMVLAARLPGVRSGGATDPGTSPSGWRPPGSVSSVARTPRPPASSGGPWVLHPGSATTAGPSTASMPPARRWPVPVRAQLRRRTRPIGPAGGGRPPPGWGPIWPPGPSKPSPAMLRPGPSPPVRSSAGRRPQTRPTSAKRRRSRSCPRTSRGTDRRFGPE